MQSNIIKELKGYSGCPLYLMNANKNLIVRKVSASKDYNIRLQKQCLKQERFIKKGFITTPNVVERGYTLDGLYFFDMEYIKGQTFSNYLQTCSIDDFLGRLKLLVNWCTSSSNMNRYRVETKAIFLKKINQLRFSISYFENKATIFKFLDNVPWEKVPHSICHGDLTVQNAIIYQDKIYLLDFLDSFYDSWMIDISKLLQDLELGWTFRYEELSVETKLKMKIGSQYITDCLDNLSWGGARYLVYSLLLLNILRIYPYCKDELTHKWIERSTDYLLTKCLK